ncbi:copper amine oxidase N-terminal domain-containing protein [Cohnella rhizosphaerae]|uniref:Copper amine oxidase N-terminal domain-containing protein n=1 Tax=Cohnella rhizosphaerae TaxID=1457232 RepID=A0A9X4KU44_9BACL|nr:copper amine oxidase N-terminal domain-containing protein [Cohnella rhizosphaerae]MDG0808267.1 copper amine oxidase N-terminal domain-containing protein [Cohnella rhizosphaerae]
MSLQKKDKVEIVKGSVMVPIRFIAENLGLLVTWNQTDKQVKIWSGNGDIMLTIGHSTASVGDAKVKLNAAPVNRSGTTLVPLRFVGESAGMDIGWDNARKIVTLTTSEPSEPWLPPSPTPSPSPSTEPTPTPAPGTPSTPSPSPTPAAGGLIKGIGWSDGRLAISFTGSLIPKTYADADPSRIVVELPNTAFDPAFSTLQPYDAATQSGEFAISDGSGATHVDYAVTDAVSKTVTITLDLAADKPFSAYQEADVESNVYVVDLKPSATPTPPPVNPNNGKKNRRHRSWTRRRRPGRHRRHQKAGKIF